MIMGPSGLMALCGQFDYAVIESICFPSACIKGKLSEGYKIQLVAFNRPDGELRIATWKHSVAVIAAVFPEVADIITAQARALKKASFEDFEREAGFCFADVDALGPDDPRFMTVKRLLES